MNKIRNEYTYLFHTEISFALFFAAPKRAGAMIRLYVLIVGKTSNIPITKFEKINPKTCSENKPHIPTMRKRSILNIECTLLKSTNKV
jgi:hypothetical protein